MRISSWLERHRLRAADLAEDGGRPGSAGLAWRPAAPPREAGAPSDKAARSQVTAGRIVGRPVYDRAGERIGAVHDLTVDKLSGVVVYVLLVSGGRLGLGRRYRPLPWALFSYAPMRWGFELPLLREQVLARPALRRTQLHPYGDGYRSPFDAVDAMIYGNLPMV